MFEADFTIGIQVNNMVKLPEWAVWRGVRPASGRFALHNENLTERGEIYEQHCI